MLFAFWVQSRPVVGWQTKRCFMLTACCVVSRTWKTNLYVLQGSIVVMLIGAIIAGATDLTYSLPGYIWVSVCAISTAMYLLLIRALKDSTGELPYALCCCHFLSLQTAMHYMFPELLVFWPATTSDLHQSLHSRICAA